MVDIMTMSDEELAAIAAGQRRKKRVEAASDEELERIASGAPATGADTGNRSFTAADMDLSGYQKPTGITEEIKRDGPSILQKARQVAETGSDLARIAVDSAGLGSADYLAGGDQQKLTQEARDRQGWLGTAADLAGGMTTPTGVFGKAKGAWNIGKHAISGGAQGFANEWTHGDGDVSDLAWATAEGAGLGGAGAKIGDLIGGWRGRRAARANLPDEAAMKAKSKAKYGEVEKGGGVYHRDDVRQLMAEFNNIQLDPGLDDRAIAWRKAFQKNFVGKDIPPEDMDRIRQIIAKKMTTPNWSDRDAGKQFREGMDKWAKNTPIQSRSGQNLQGLNDALLEARALHSARMNLKDVNKAAPINSGHNTVTRFLNRYGEKTNEASRTRFQKLRDKPGFNTAAQQEQLEKLGQGTTASHIGDAVHTVNPIRSVPAFFGGSGIATAAGLLSGLPAAGAAAAVGGGMEAVERIGKNSTQKAIDDMRSLVVNGKKIEADPEQVRKARELLARLMASGGRTGDNERRAWMTPNGDTVY